MSGPAPLRSHLPWRVAAVLVLFGGAGFALWQDPNLLDRPFVTWSIVACFVALWMAPRLRDQRAEKIAQRQAAEAQSAILWQDRPKAGRGAVDTGFGLIFGLIGTGLVLTVPGVVGWLSSGPMAVDWLFDAVGPYGVLAVVVMAVAAIAALRFALGLGLHAIRASRLVGGIVMGAALWLPFHDVFEAVFARIGIALPGLHQNVGG